MKPRNIIAAVLFILSLIFAMLSMPFSGAISYGKLERPAFAKVADDEYAALALEGFKNGIYNMKKRYRKFGAITNNTERELIVDIIIVTEFPEVTNKNFWFGIRFGEYEPIIFDHNSDSCKSIQLLLAPGQSMDAMAAVQRNQSRNVITSFQFIARDSAGSYQINLSDTHDAPRRIICY